jgi:hypothetical protein
MTTSAHKTTTGPAFSARALQIAVSDDYLAVQLEDGRRIEVPLVWFPHLAQSSTEQRKNWRLIGRGVGIHWPDIDEDISVESLLAPRRDDVLAYRSGPEVVDVERRRRRGRPRTTEEQPVGRNARGQFVVRTYEKGGMGMRSYAVANPIADTVASAIDASPPTDASPTPSPPTS